MSLPSFHHHHHRLVYSSVSRLLRLLAIVFLLFGIFHFVTYACNQSRFQTFLSNHYITWDDFPTQYSNTLQSKDWNRLRIDTFDYEHVFPRSASHTNDTIPPHIHFIWFQKLYESRPGVTDMPSLGSNAPQLCAEHNPRYTIEVWNATSARALLEAHYAWFLPVYDAYRYPIQRIDAVKYFVLWHHGGVYMDMDIACRRPLDPLLAFPAWFPEARPLGVNNDVMASRARHPAVWRMLEHLPARDRSWGFPYLTVFWSTGPQFVGDMLKEGFLRRREGDDGSDVDSFFVLPLAFYSEEYSFFGHRPGGTWHGPDVAVVLWFVAHRFLFAALATSMLGGCCFSAALAYRKQKKERWARARVRDAQS